MDSTKWVVLWCGNRREKEVWVVDLVVATGSDLDGELVGDYSWII